jgi:hypothetical protein
MAGACTDICACGLVQEFFLALTRKHKCRLFFLETFFLRATGGGTITPWQDSGAHTELDCLKPPPPSRQISEYQGSRRRHA